MKPITRDQFRPGELFQTSVGPISRTYDTTPMNENQCGLNPVPRAVFRMG